MVANPLWLGGMKVSEEQRERVFKEFKSLWRYGHPTFYELVIRMCEIHEIKNKGYGLGNPLGNFMESKRFGVPPWKGCLVRISDKVSRLYNLASKKDDPEFSDAVKMESLEDTLIDLANYCLLCIILLREDSNNKREK